MSFWTSVNGEFKGILNSSMPEGEEKNFLKYIFGRELTFENDPEEFGYAVKYPDEYLPFGSEGSLKAKYRFNKKTRKFSVRVWGNLRDKNDPNPIIIWAQRVTQKLQADIRHVSITAEVDGGWIAETWTYHKAVDDEED